jgi:hypothetical protein
MSEFSELKHLGLFRHVDGFFVATATSDDGTRTIRVCGIRPESRYGVSWKTAAMSEILAVRRLSLDLLKTWITWERMGRPT